LQEGGESYRRVIVAVAPYHLPRLIDELPELAPLGKEVAALEWEPIVTAYLGYPSQVRLPFPMIGTTGGHAQWLFDRGALCGQPGVIAAVISARGRHDDLGHDVLAQRIHEEIGRVVPRLPAPRWTRVIAEKRATFACTPAMSRPATVTALPGLFLAGDYVAGDYPATIEGAVRSGVRAARSAIDQTPGGQP
jgi:predicted NAD/FAD-dependent oxidoreductase